MEENKECPKCGSSEIGQGKQMRQAKMLPIDNISILGGSDIISDICTNCGHILDMRVEKPEKFK